ncbi:pyridoxamine 5'-phosphate oxidase family protein [Dactylosporangium vinaceum]|uniref:Pyridoxamine 5'-phosphate oxidase family protein n=1 Tax=Dactylosporangium vinaceum TaxID=53362 RepID=A0ABV5LY30_9ACTN|nr:pyridoxamine 5'-phosphate oxidase family protein [Dactylosporangium vinaceum]UAB95777.1 pyridoxamine 5'-phosphate oxidase family protein [Dactylosporangium vinaceum]
MEAPVERTRIRRLPDKAVHDRAALHAVLDAGMVAHVAFVHDGHPFAIPVAYARDGESVLFHGSTGSRLFRLLATGVPCCLTVTLLDGLILARSAFEASMRYRSAMVLGACAPVTEKTEALRAVAEHLMPGRWEVIRPPSAKELAATSVLRLPLDEWSLKVSDGWPEATPEDEGWSPPTGVIPIRTELGELIPGEVT